MKLFKAITAIGTLALLALVAIPSLRAQSRFVWNQKTIMTFSQPVEIPGGQVLPAGTYVFKLLDSPSNRNIVQILDEKETHTYATVLAISNDRLHSAENTVVNFEERPSGSPQAIKVWFHPGGSDGHEFVYPKARAVELAKMVNEPVPSIETLPTEESVVALEKAPVKVEEPSGEELPVSKAFPSTTEAVSLPKTASSVPLVGLIGLLSLTVAFTLLIVTKKIS
jgi:hypothetical protein